MLRIINSSTNTEQRWILCGQLSGRWVEELRTNWRKELSTSNGRRRIVDLTDVMFIDESGESLLRELEREGAEFEGTSGVETRHLVENLRAGKTGTIRKHLTCRE
jgi:ABC-type transporter Mla MlaB component